MLMRPNDITAYLRGAGLVVTDDVTITPLRGGVSSDIYLVTEGDKSFVIKRALPKLRVKDDWYADVSRNQVEQEYLRYVGKIIPEAVPKILHTDPDQKLFIMEYLGDGFVSWKQLLLQERVEPALALEAARILGTIHNHSWGDAAARETFDTTQNFFDLRLEPYLLATAKRHPPLAEYFEREAERITRTRLCLVHGDYSPKNILIGETRLVILDCEVAWYGDPAFDVAFMLNHFFLKSLHFAPASEPYLNLISLFWDRYSQALSDRTYPDGLEARVATLLPMLLLARIDGKSPVEYISDEHKKDIVRTFAAKALSRQVDSINHLMGKWSTLLPSGIQPNKI